jgi:hypothetical protein
VAGGVVTSVVATAGGAFGVHTAGDTTIVSADGRWLLCRERPVMSNNNKTKRAPIARIAYNSFRFFSCVFVVRKLGSVERFFAAGFRVNIRVSRVWTSIILARFVWFLPFLGAGAGAGGGLFFAEFAGLLGILVFLLNPASLAEKGLKTKGFIVNVLHPVLYTK